jgi:hypothetical protein
LIPRLLQWKRRSRATAESGPGKARRVLQFPLRTPVRTAIIEKGFIPERNARVFDPDDLGGLSEFAPEAIVAPLKTALRLAQGGELPGLAAFVILTDIDGEPLGEDQREFLWRRFGVPVFEQLRGPEGDVFARECEVHDGLHVDPTARLARDLRALEAAMIDDPCDCGAETPRLRGYRRTPALVEI